MGPEPAENAGADDGGEAFDGHPVAEADVRWGAVHQDAVAGADVDALGESVGM